MKMKKNKYLVSPDINNITLTQNIKGVDQDNNQVKIRVIQERDLTIFLNNQEIVTLMSIGDHPKYLSIGYLLNQNMLKLTDKINSIQNDSELKDLKNLITIADETLLKWYIEKNNKHSVPINKVSKMLKGFKV